MSTPNGRASERPLVSVTGPAGFLFLPPRTDRKTQIRQSGAEVRAKNRTCKRRPRYFPGGKEGGAPPRNLPPLSADLRPSYTQIIQQLLLIMPLSRNYVLAPLLSSLASVGPLGRPVLVRPSLPAPPSRAVSFEIHKAAAFSLSMAQRFHNWCWVRGMTYV